METVSEYLRDFSIDEIEYDKLRDNLLRIKVKKEAIFT